jgi:hypothetical protein
MSNLNWNRPGYKVATSKSIPVIMSKIYLDDDKSKDIKRMVDWVFNKDKHKFENYKIDTILRLTGVMHEEFGINDAVIKRMFIRWIIADNVLDSNSQYSDLTQIIHYMWKNLDKLQKSLDAQLLSGK